MKNIKTLLIILLGFLGVTAMGSDTLYVKFNNFYVKDGPTNDTLLFDVEFKSYTAGTYLTAYQLDINFNTTVFGVNALPVAYSFLELTGVGMVVQAGPVNPTTSRFRIAKAPLLPPYQPASFVMVPNTEFAGVMRFKMLVLDNSQPAGISFNIAAMTTNQKFIVGVSNSQSPYVPIVAENDLLNMVTTPTNMDLMFSELGDPGDSGADFVEIYNAGTDAVDFSVFPWFVTAYDGVDYENVQLTGTLAAGESYVVGGSLFAAAYPGKPLDLTSEIVVGAGTLEVFLSMFGEYTEGLDIDQFTGTYTGQHAVRYYDVVLPNTTYDAAEWVISAADAIDMTPGSHRMDLTWDGSAGTEWRDTSNWATSYIPDAGHNAVIPNGGEPIPVIGNGDNGFANDLTIGGSGAGLIIESDMTNGDGSLITYGTVTGDAAVQRYLGADRYWYVTQPVTSAVAGVFLHTWMFTYDETINAWADFIEPETTPLDLMQGYAVWTSSVNPWHYGWDPVGDTTVAWEGVLNTGAQSTPLTFTVDGWNFTGNPYPSAVDWEATGWVKSGLASDAYSVWDGATYGTYTVGSGGTNGATQYIPAAQGFFVQANAAGSLGLTDMVRTHNAQAFWKNQENMMNRLSLTISNGEVNDETVIYFNQNATPEMDYEYDAAKLMAPGAPQAYTMMGDKMMAINTYNNTGVTASVNMGINTPETGEYTITASNIESFDGTTPIFLEDLVSGEYVNLREVSSYSFSSEVGASARFVVHFSDTQGIGDPTGKEVNNIYTYDQQVYVDFNGTRGEISIYNILGQEISRTTASNGMNILSVPQGNAVYIVKVISENVNVTKKVFVK